MVSLSYRRGLGRLVTNKFSFSRRLKSSIIQHLQPGRNLPTYPSSGYTVLLCTLKMVTVISAETLVNFFQAGRRNFYIHQGRQLKSHVTDNLLHKNSLAFNGSRQIITEFTRECPLVRSMSQMNLIHILSPINLRFIFI